ncbi:hypothetical protein CL647_04950, partial [bacterium]|nr:hypothetical protein [bacterium]
MRITTLVLTAASIAASTFNPIMAAGNSKPKKDTTRINNFETLGDGRFNLNINTGDRAVAIDSFGNGIVLTEMEPKNPKQACKNGDQECHKSNTDQTKTDKTTEKETVFA